MEHGQNTNILLRIVNKFTLQQGKKLKLKECVVCVTGAN